MSPPSEILREFSLKSYATVCISISIVIVAEFNAC